MLGQREDNEMEDIKDDDIDEEALRLEIKENLRRSRNDRSEWRQEAREDYAFFAGDQWSDEDQTKLDEEKRPAVVFNRIVRTINAVSGIEIQNRQEVRYYARNIVPDSPPGQPNDSGYSDVMNQATKWVRDQNGAEDEESESFQDDLICGEVWTETRMDYDTNPQGMVIKDRIDPLTTLVDPDSRKRNYDDAKWVAYVKDYSVKEIRSMYPELESFNTGAFWGDSVDNSGAPHDADNDWKYQNDQSSKMMESGKVAVVLYQCYKLVPAYIIITEQGNVVTIDKKRYDLVKNVVLPQSVKVIKTKQRVYHQYIMVGDQFAAKYKIKCNDFTLKCMTGIRDRNKNKWFGLVRMMKDPQRWANKWLSQIQHILNSNAKGGYFVEVGAVNNIRKFEDQVSDPASVTVLNSGGLAKLKEKQSPEYPQGIANLLTYAITAINDIPGVNLELLGQADRDQPIGLEVTRKQSGITILANFFDSLRRYRKADGKILAYFIREFIADGRLIRIVGQQGANYIPLMKDKMAFEYDIVVDDSPTSPNVKDRNFAILMQMIPLAIQAQIPIPPEILDYAPLSEDLVQKWKQMLQPDPKQQQQQQEVQQLQQQMAQIQAMQAQLDLMETQATIQKIGSETAKNYATAEKDKAVGEEQQALAMQQMGVVHGEQQLKNQEFMATQRRKDLELMLNQQRKSLEVRLNAILEAHKQLRVPSMPMIQ